MISVAMATYNGEQFLQEQLDSIFNQNYSDIEIIVCDDCSTDGTWALLKQNEEKDSRLHCYRNSSNLGFKKNFEKAISLCKGDYIALSDQDDVWLPNHLSDLLLILGNNSIACGNSLLIDSFGNSLEKQLNEVDKLYNFSSSKCIYKIIFDRNSFQGASMLMRREFANSCLPIPDTISYHDVWFACCACLENKISYVFDIITLYRQHGNNITFFDHNKKHISILHKIQIYLNYIFYGVPTERFDYCEQLYKKYGDKNGDFLEIYYFFQHRLSRKIAFRDIKLLWDNYEYIQTIPGHNGFIVNLYKWLKWRKSK